LIQNTSSIYNNKANVNGISFVYPKGDWMIDDISGVTSSLSSISLNEDTATAKHIFIKVSLWESNQTYCYNFDQSNGR
jgi:hypothetical protein